MSTSGLGTCCATFSFTDYHKTRRAGHQNDVASFTVFDGLHETDPEDRFFEHIVVDEVLQAIDRLSPQFREALLQSVEGLQYDEIARVTGVALGTVKSRLFRGRQVLQDALYDYAVEQGTSTRTKMPILARPFGSSLVRPDIS